MSGVFGSSGKQARAKDMTPAEYAGLRQPVANSLTGIIQNGGLPQYQGQIAAPITGTEQNILNSQTLQGQPSAATTQAMQTLQNIAAGQVNPYAQASGLEQFGLGQVMNQAYQQQYGASPLGQIASGSQMYANSNPYLQSAIQAATQPILDQFGDAAVAARQQAAMNGQQIGQNASSPFEYAQAKLQTGLANALGSTASNIAYQNYNDAANRQLQAIQQGEAGQQNAFQNALNAQQQYSALQNRQANSFAQTQQNALTAAQAAPQADRTQVESTIEALQAQALPRMIQQYGLDQGLAMYQQQQQSLLSALTTAGGLGSPTIVQLPGTAASSGILGGLASGLGMGLGGAIGSDARIKDNIVHVGAIGPHNVYVWDWKPEAGEYAKNAPFGVIAQEVAAIRPDAVAPDARGILTVDYSRLR